MFLSVLNVIYVCLTVCLVCADSYDTSGVCGDNLQWSFDNNTKQLTISGSGKMDCSRPWNAFKQLIESVAFQGSVTSIGSYAFSGCVSLKSITIPSTITEIGHRAFENCVSLTSITIPQSVKSIASEPFVGCTSLSAIHVDSGNTYYEDIDDVLFRKSDHALLTYPAAKRGDYNIPEGTIQISSFAFYESVYLTSVTIPDTVTAICENAFSFCTSLKTVSIPASVTSIGSSPFRSCSNLTLIEVDSNNEYHKSVDGVLFNKEGTKLIQYPGAKRGHYTIPADVTSIDAAFTRCAGLISVTIPSSIQEIEYSTFQRCSNLEYVSYLGTSNPGTDVVFSKCDKLSAIFVPLDYEYPEFCGKSNICKTERPDNINNCCFYAICENGEIVMKKRDNATKWEEQSNQCVEHLCDNESGIGERFICTSTDTMNRTCVNGKCIYGKSFDDKPWSVELELTDVKATDINPIEVLELITKLADTEKDTIIIGMVVDENEYLIEIILFLNDEETATRISSALNNMEKGEGCQGGVLCSTHKITIRGKGWSALSGENHITISMICLILSLFISFVIL